MTTVPTLHEYVLLELERSKGKWPEVAMASGVSKRTIEKIARGEIADPGVSHMQKLADHFRRKGLEDRLTGKAA